MSVSWFREHKDAVFEAHFRAALVRRRYRVWYEPSNRWWYLRETHQLLEGHAEYHAADGGRS